MMRPFSEALPAIRAGSDSPRALLERCLAAIEEREAQVGAFVHLNILGARAQADAASGRWRQGRPLSPIDGMPVGIKDIIETDDMPTQQGSPLFIGWRSERDAATVAALREAGAVILGKTVTTEFASTEPRGTRNPHDLERTPGGSSSGSAAGVAAGFISLGLGTQVIGSILRPASFCGTIGFKPTVGAINRGGSFDGLSQSVDGVLAASLWDAWQTLYEIASRVGGDPGYPGLIGPAAPPPPQAPRTLAFLETAGWAEAHPAAKAGLEALVKRLEAAGVAIRTRRNDAAIAAVETAIADANALSRRINTWETRWPLNVYKKRDARRLSQASLDRLAQAEAMKPEDYRAAIAERSRIRAVYGELAKTVDACISLTATGPAPKGLGSTGNPIFVVPGSLLGVPTLSLPLLEVESLPLGVQLLGFEHGDEKLFAAAAWLSEAAAP